MRSMLLFAATALGPAFAFADEPSTGFMELDISDPVVGAGFTTGVTAACVREGMSGFTEKEVAEFRLRLAFESTAKGIDLTGKDNVDRYHEGIDAAPSYINTLGGAEAACSIFRAQLEAASNAKMATNDTEEATE